jgi:hypothetical protein
VGEEEIDPEALESFSAEDRKRYGIPNYLSDEQTRQMIFGFLVHPGAARERLNEVSERRRLKRAKQIREAIYVVAGLLVVVVAGLLAKANNNDNTGKVEVVVGIIIALALFIRSTNLESSNYSELSGSSSSSPGRRTKDASKSMVASSDSFRTVAYAETQTALRAVSSDITSRALPAAISPSIRAPHR